MFCSCVRQQTCIATNTAIAAQIMAILVAKATKENSYTDITITLEFRFMQLILLRGQLGDNAQVD